MLFFILIILCSKKTNNSIILDKYIIERNVKFMNNLVNLEKNNSIKSFLKGYLYSILITCILLCVYAITLVNTNIKEDSINLVVIIITAISILIGSSFSCLKIKKNGILIGISIGAFYFFSLYILSAVLGNGFLLNLKSVIMIISGTILGGIGGIIGVNMRK